MPSPTTFPPSKLGELAPWLVTCATAGFSLLGIVVAGVLDYLTGAELRAYPLYFLPIAYGAWRLPRAGALLLALVSTGAWLWSNILAGTEYTEGYVWVVNTTAQLLAFGLVAHLIADLRQRLASERDLSRLDALTGLQNSRAFYESAELLVALARRSATPVTLAFMDLDNFKKVNDKHGHHAGDQALIAAAGAMRRQTRESDLLTRLGGDEFALLLTNAGQDAARNVLERLRQQIAAEMSANGWPITVSVGAVSYSVAPPSLKEAMRRADSVMYRAKHAGKNAVHLEQEPSRRGPADP